MVTVNDLIERWRPLTQAEIDQATVFLSDCENALHVYAYDRGFDLDEMMDEYPPRANLYTAIVCDIVRREMQSATFLSPGGGLFIKNSELKLLGLANQKARAVDIYGN